jgi:demethylmenaquinone methyltransferase/2-methoxy-6-polyprenyl-1,4-benzoquinol methylase
MLEIGREKSARAGARDQITFVRADAHSLPFADNEFQIVSVAFGLRNIADTDLGLREMVRVCRPGGKVAILEFSMPRRQPVKAAYQWYFKNILPRIGQRLAKNNSDAYNYLSESVSEFPSYEHLVIRMLAAGLTRAYYKPLTFGIATLYVGFK